MKIRIITPAPRGTRYGNRVTALRWASILRGLGHRVIIEQNYHGAPCDVLVALHARRSADSIARFSQMHPDLPLIVTLTGTDLYQDIHISLTAQRSLELATHLVTLQPLGRDELAPQLRDKVRVILQSAPKTPIGRRPDGRTFDISVVGHLRAVKDPLRAALAARLLPKSSRIRVLHVGVAMSDDMAVQARAEAQRNPRYVWPGELPRWRTRRVIARSRALVLSSLMEGGANVISEALVDSVPVLASRIPGSVGLLGKEYPGYYPTENTRELARLMTQVERDSDFRERLVEWCAGLAEQFHPDHERAAWEQLLEELAHRPIPSPVLADATR